MTPTPESSPADTRRRFFASAEITAAWLRQDRHCADCGREMPRDLIEGDHIVPWTSGGLTVLDNLQALCVACNRRKGNRAAPATKPFVPQVSLSTATLRDWQNDALEVVAATHHALLIEACPGAGKTRFAIEAAARMIRAGEVNRVLVVAPTRRIVEQWVEAAQGIDGAATVPLASAGWRPTQPLYPPWCGAVFTYHALFAQTTMFAALAAEPGYRSLVIFDEVHHAGSESGWGVSAQQAFAGSANRIISLSGTPFRTKDPIVFVHTVEGQSVADFRYDYGTALRDTVCRPIRFAVIAGSATFTVPTGETHTVSFDDDLNPRGESYRLRTALATNGEHLATMLDLGNAQLRALRSAGDRDAAGLVVCIDCDHADQVAELLAKRAGLRPPVACSRLNNPDDPAPGPAINTFRDGRDPWIVAVRMVSEGVDITRLRVLVYATNVVTDLSFRQLVGRVVRTDAANGRDDYGVVILPADPRLVSLAQNIRDESPARIELPIIVTDPSPQSINLLARAPLGKFVPLASTGELRMVTDTLGRTAEAELVALAERYVAETGSRIPAFELALAASNDEALRTALQDQHADRRNKR
jgi:superfamily II DNA or RNA helicase